MQGNVPLHSAVEKNKAESCRALLDLGANPNILNNARLSPLHLAVSLGHNSLVEVRDCGVFAAVFALAFSFIVTDYKGIANVHTPHIG